MNHKVICTLAVVLMTGIAPAQGPLTPPGAPAPLMKTLEQVEPRTPVNAVNTPGDTNAVYVISQPGSYYLTGDVLGVPDQHGIRIDADYVTLDLNGYTLDGVIGSLSGIHAVFPVDSVFVLRNGRVRFWGEHGVEVTGGAVTLEALQANGNTGHGFIANVTGALLRDCEAIDNGGMGFLVPVSVGVVADCKARNNGEDGIRVDVGSLVVVGCEATGNAGGGIVSREGPDPNQPRVVRDSLAANNTLEGVYMPRASLITRTVVVSNLAVGVRTRGNSRIKDVVAAYNHNQGGQYGIQVFKTNTSPNVATYITGTSAHRNGNGIGMETMRNRVQDNHATENEFQGIDVKSGGDFSILFGNTLAGNGQIPVMYTTNTIAHTVTAPASAAVSGDTGGAGLGTTDPWVNILQ